MERNTIDWASVQARNITVKNKLSGPALEIYLHEFSKIEFSLLIY